MTAKKSASVASQISFRTKLFFLLVGALISQLIAHKMSDHNDVKREAIARDWVAKIVAAEKSHQASTGDFSPDLQAIGFADPKLFDMHFFTDDQAMPEGLRKRLLPEEIPAFGNDHFHFVTAYTCEGNEYGCLLNADGVIVKKRVLEVK